MQNVVFNFLTLKFSCLFIAVLVGVRSLMLSTSPKADVEWCRYNIDRGLMTFDIMRKPNPKIV